MKSFSFTFTVLFDVIDKGVGREGRVDVTRHPGREALENSVVSLADFTTQLQDVLFGLFNHMRSGRVFEDDNVRPSGACFVQMPATRRIQYRVSSRRNKDRNGV